MPGDPKWVLPKKYSIKFKFTNFVSQVSSDIFVTDSFQLSLCQDNHMFYVLLLRCLYLFITVIDHIAALS